MMNQLHVRSASTISVIARSNQQLRLVHSKRRKDENLLEPQLKGRIIHPRRMKKPSLESTPLLESALHTKLLYSSAVKNHRNLFAGRNAGGQITNYQASTRFGLKHLRRVVELDEKQNFSEALKQIYGGVASVQGHRAQEAEVVVENEENREKQVVFPLGLVQATDFSPPLLQSGQQDVNASQKTNDDENVEEIDMKEMKNTKNGLGRRPRKSNISGKDGSKSEEEIDKDDKEGKSEKKEMLLANDELFRYGTPDITIPASDVPCGGCGALLHCNDPKLPGYTPSESFVNKSREELRTILCERCRIIKKYNIALKMDVDKEIYPRLIRQQLGHNSKAIVLLVVDLLDCPGSLRDDIVALMGFNKRIILVGNKIDLIPQDSSNYLKRVETSMRQAFLKKCNENSLITYDPSKIESVLVSARTGFNIEHLISKIFSSWNEMGHGIGRDIFIVGTTNVGKSSIFNMLLESDLCKVKAIEKVEKAMTSPVPGTTLNLLKFPLMRPDPSRLYQRLTRLRRTRNVFNQEEEKRLKMLRSTADPKYGTPRGMVGQSFYDKSDKFLPLTAGLFEMRQLEESDVNLPSRLDPNHPDFASGKWCYDTPGTVTEDQIVDLLTQEELALALPEMPIRPRSFHLKLGHTLFLGGLARLDLIQGTFKDKSMPIVTTIFASESLPINIVRSEDAEHFYQENLKHREIMGVPQGSQKRLEQWPKLEFRQFEVDSISQLECAADIVLSSIGWITLCPPVSTFLTVNVWTPMGRGLWLREPPFLPFAHLLKGTKIKGSLAFANDGVFVKD